MSLAKKLSLTTSILPLFVGMTSWIGCHNNIMSNSVEHATPMDKLQNQIVVAQIKIYPEKGDLPGNFKKLMALLDQIEQEPGVDVVVTPEGFLDGYVVTEKKVRREDMYQYAIDPETSEYTKAVAVWAKRNNTWVIMGCARIEKNKIYNTALIFNRNGVKIGSYDKLHIQTHDKKYDPGQHLNVYDSDFGKFGVMICADRRWPETTRTLASKGARIVFNPTYGFKGELNTCIMRTRAHENGIYITFTHPGESLVTGPRGKIYNQNTQKDQPYTITEINLNKAKANKDNHIRDRRPDVYDF
ncbi:MAG: carbon-nitrogen hydrolase family protein [Sedimentisphaerales bacterium]|nr:carbon-nitrogen hydrolase family protein [Sedimentisphaerales bacterium]